MKVEIIKIEGKNIEYVIEGGQNVESAELADWVKTEYVKLGPAELTITDEKVSFCSMNQSDPGKKAEVKSPTNPTSQETGKDIVNIKGKDFMTYEGLLKKAHEKGKFDLVVIEKKISEDMKTAWCHVRLTADGQTIDGMGSSTPENTGSMTENHPIEMAHTRAKGRALRDYLNIGLVMAEELKDQK